MDPPIQAHEAPPPKSPIRRTNSVDQTVEKTIPESKEEAAVTSREADENGESENSLDALAKGVSSLLTIAFTDFESKASSAVKSQDNLLFAMDRRSRTLQEVAPVPSIMQHAAKISAVRKRVAFFERSAEINSKDAGQSEEMVDPNMGTRPSTRALKRALQKAMRCVDPDPEKRPKMSQVVRMLQSEEYPILY